MRASIVIATALVALLCVAHVHGAWHSVDKWIDECVKAEEQGASCKADGEPHKNDLEGAFKQAMIARNTAMKAVWDAEQKGEGGVAGEGTQHNVELYVQAATELPKDKGVKLKQLLQQITKVTLTKNSPPIDHSFVGQFEVEPQAAAAAAFLEVQSTRKHHKRHRRNSFETAEAWPGAEVKYKWDAAIKPAARTKIVDAMAEYTNKVKKGDGSACIKFTQDDAATLVFRDTQADRCYANVLGKSATILNLGAQCSKGNGIHELAHILGFAHTQKRKDAQKDDTANPKIPGRIRINDANIQADKISQFKPVLDVGFALHPAQLDVKSIMMYPINAFCKEQHGSCVGDSMNSLASWPVNWWEEYHMGQRDGLSAQDIAGIKAAYGC